MPDPNQGIACPACGKRYYWEDRLARRLVRCACGVIMRMPETPDAPATRHEPAEVPASATPLPDAAAAPEEGAYELAAPPPDPSESAPPGPPITRCPACGTSFATGAVLCLNCGFNIQTGRRVTLADPAEADPLPAAEEADAEATEAEAAPATNPVVDQLTDRTIPITLLVIGLVVNVGQHAYYGGARGVGLSLPAAVVEVAAGLVATVLLLLIGIAAAARLADLDFGPLGTALLKLLAITVAPEAIGLLIYYLLDHLVGAGISGGFVGGMVALALYWILASRLFHLDFYETAVTMAMIAITFIITGMVTGLVRAIFS